MQVSESAFKDHGAVFENLHWDILKETGYMSWFGLAFTLAGYVSAYCGGGEDFDGRQEMVKSDDAKRPHHRPA